MHIYCRTKNNELHYAIRKARLIYYNEFSIFAKDLCSCEFSLSFPDRGSLSGGMN